MGGRSATSARCGHEHGVRAARPRAAVDDEHLRPGRWRSDRLATAGHRLERRHAADVAPEDRRQLRPAATSPRGQGTGAVPASWASAAQAHAACVRPDEAYMADTRLPSISRPCSVASQVPRPEIAAASAGSPMAMPRIEHNTIELCFIAVLEELRVILRHRRRSLSVGDGVSAMSNRIDRRTDCSSSPGIAHIASLRGLVLHDHIRL